MRIGRDCLAALLALLLAVAPAAGAETTVEAGDTVKVTILEAPELNGTATVGADGQIMLAGVGSLAVAGRSLEQVRDLVADRIRELDLIWEPTVRVVFEAWRPYYVTGAVVHSSVYPYAPGITVRQALATAGGIVTPEAEADVALEVAQLVTERRAVAFRLLQVEARIAGLRNALDGKPQDAAPLPSLPGVPEADARAVMEQELALREDVARRQEGERAHLETALDLVSVELDVLQQQSRLQVEEQGRQQEEIDSTRALLKKGIVPNSRLSEVIRDNSRLLSDMLDVQSYIARARQQDATIRHQIRSADADWRIKMRADLAEAQATQVSLEAELQGYTNRLLAEGAKTAAADAAAGAVTEMRIFRRTSGSAETLAATMETEILPGDVLEVAHTLPPRG